MSQDLAGGGISCSGSGSVPGMDALELEESDDNSTY